MKTLRQFCFSIVLLTVVVAPALGGETQTPPGETHTPPAASNQTGTPITVGGDGASSGALGDTLTPPIPGETSGPPPIALLLYLVQTWL